MKTLPRSLYLLVSILLLVLYGPQDLAAQEDSANALQLATFDIDATPPVGFMMAYDRVKRVEELGLRCRGIVLIGADKPIVLCAVDWIGIGNAGHDAFRQHLARAAGTTPERVAVHTLHQHDAPRCDFTAEQLLHQAGASDLGPHDGSLARDVLKRLESAVRDAVQSARTITHAGFGTADVEKVASNRRILGDDGTVVATRYTTTRDPKLRALPNGVIDPQLSTLTFYQQDQPLAVLSYYACHPQSYYRTGIPSPDFPGIARFLRGQDVPNVLHVHFNGAGGNIGAGKYNDGNPENRLILARRVADAMARAYDATEKFELSPADVDWRVEPISLPLGKHLDRETLEAKMSDASATEYWGAAEQLAWVLRSESGHPIDIGCLYMGNVRILHMPGELFVEYQLAAKQLRPDLKVAMAAYGDYGPGYIGTEVAYGQGGYETSERASKVGPGSERVLMEAVESLLGVER